MNLMTRNQADVYHENYNGFIISFYIHGLLWNELFEVNVSRGVIGMAIVNPLPPCFGGRHSTVNGSDKSVQNGSIYLPNVTTLIKKRFGNEKPFVTND